MIDKSNEHSSQTNASKPTKGNDTEAANFKLLYQNMPNSERDKSSGVSSDEEETSSSLLPIPDTLRAIRKKLKRTISDAKHDSAWNASEILEKPSEKVKSSLEELRKKYVLKNETSVALKMNSANLILDDILNSTNSNITSNNNLQTGFFKQREFNSKTLSYTNVNEANETSTTESSVSAPKHCPHILDHSHSIAYDLFPLSCMSHRSFSQSLHNPTKKDLQTNCIQKTLEDTQKKRTILEKMQDFRIKYKLQSIYRALQRTRNPFAKGKEVTKIQQGIPGVGYQENEQSVFKCENCQHSKILNLDLLENSELSQSESRSTESEARHCTCITQRECDCPEVIPKCKCTMMSSEINSKNPKHNISHSEVPENNNNECIHGAQSSRSTSLKKEASKLLHEENENEDEDKKRKKKLLSKHFQGNKYCSQERRIIERTDIYYFDHGNSAYYQTTDNHPMRYTECLVERTDHYATKFWAEFFGTIEIGIAFLISFFIQFYRFLFTSVIRSLTIGVLQIFSDYFFKPILTIIFNGIIQPCLILAYNIATSLRDLCLPISQIFGFFAKEIAVILKSCRLVEVGRDKQTSCYCGNKCIKAMTSWTERMHRRAATFSNVVTSCGHPSVPYPRRLEKVKFGVPIDEVCKNDIPGSLLVLILKLNKEAPEKKDVFRAPGHQGNMKKLIHFLQAGRLVNLDNFSVYTIASVLKKFLRKLPGGIFGREGEQELFQIIELDNVDEQREMIQRLIVTLPVHTQRLLVLLFGTFRVIATNSDRCQTGMTSEALGVSVAPSFFQTCVSDGKQAKMEDVQRFKVATKIMKFMIDNFGVSNLFGRENYEYYARITGRILKVEEDWIYNFRYPPDCFVSPMSQQEESQSTPALIHVPEFAGDTCNTSLSIIPKTNLLESYTRLSISLEENGLFKGSSRSSSSSANSGHQMTLEELRAVNRYAESTKSLSYLPQVHERQAARMRTRSEWFLSPLIAPGQLLYAIDSDPTSIFLLRSSCSRSSAGNIDYHLLKMLTKKGGTGLSASAESIQKRTNIRRNNSRHMHRTSSKRNKENGSSKKHSPSTSFKKTHQDKIEGKPAKYNGHETKQIKLPEQTELLKDSFVNIDRLLKESGGTENLMNIFGSQTIKESLSSVGQVQDIRLLKMTSLDASRKSNTSKSKFQKVNSLGSSSSIAKANSNPQLCIQLKDDDVSDMEVTTYNVTFNYKPRI